MSINAITSAPYFLWKGAWDTTARDSRDMGIVVTEYPPHSRPKERVTQQTIPGRQGQLTFREAEWPVYDPVLQTLQCYTRPGADIGAICAWLTGTGELTLGNDPDYVYDAVIINQIDFKQIMRGNKGYSDFAIPFQCQPFKRMKNEGFIAATGKNGTATLYAENTGHIAVPAIITVYGGGSLYVSVDDQLVAITGADSTDRSKGILIDWDTGIMTHGDNDGAVLNTKISGGPQYIKPASMRGPVPIAVSGDVAKIEVRKNWRWM
jgi:phage-related protein